MVRAVRFDGRALSRMLNGRFFRVALRVRLLLGVLGRDSTLVERRCGRV